MNCKIVPDFRKELDDCRKSLQKYCYHFKKEVIPMGQKISRPFSPQLKK